MKFQEGDKIPRTPHKLSAEKPTAFDIQFVVDGIRYAYGFSMNDVEFLDEYLYHFHLEDRRRYLNVKVQSFHME